MLHLLHIPTGKVILFYDERCRTGRTWSFQELQEHRQAKGKPLEMPKFLTAINLTLFPDEWSTTYIDISNSDDTGAAIKERLLTDTILIEVDT